MVNQAIDEFRRADVRGPVKRSLSARCKELRSGTGIQQNERDFDSSEASSGNKWIAISEIDISAGGNQRMNQTQRSICGKSPVEHLVAHIVERVTRVLVGDAPVNDRVRPSCILREQLLEDCKVPLVDCVPKFHRRPASRRSG